MNSIKSQFETIQRYNPHWSSYTCFCEALQRLKIKDKRFIWRWFNRLVDKEDYTKRIKRQVLNFLTDTLVSEK